MSNLVTVPLSLIGLLPSYSAAKEWCARSGTLASIRTSAAIATANLGRMLGLLCFAAGFAKAGMIVGYAISCGISKSTPVAGVGVHGVFRISRRVRASLHRPLRSYPRDDHRRQRDQV